MVAVFLNLSNFSFPLHSYNCHILVKNYGVFNKLNDIFEWTKYARIFFCIFWRQVHSSVEARSILVTTLDFFSTLFDSFCSSDKSSWPPNDIPYGSNLIVVGISRAEIGKNVQTFCWGGLFLFHAVLPMFHENIRSNL